MNFPSQNGVRNGAGQTSRPLSIRAGLSVQELKAMTAMRIAHTQQQDSQHANKQGNHLSYQTANPQQLRAAGIQPAVVNDRFVPSVSVTDNRSAGQSLASNAKYPSHFQTSVTVSALSSHALPAIQRPGVIDYRHLNEAGARTSNSSHYEMGSTTNARRQQYTTADFDYMNQFSGPPSVAQPRVVQFQQTQDAAVDYSAYQYRRGHMQLESQQDFIYSPPRADQPQMHSFDRNASSELNFGGLAPGINVQLSSYSSEYSQDAGHHGISSPSVSRGVSNDKSFASDDRVLTRDSGMNLRSPVLGGRLGLGELSINNGFSDTFSSTRNNNNRPIQQLPAKLEPMVSLRPHLEYGPFQADAMTEYSFAERFDEEPSSQPIQQAPRRNPFHKSKSESTLLSDLLSPVNLPSIARLDQGQPLPALGSGQPLSPLPEHTTVGNESNEVNSGFPRTDRSGSRFPLLKSKTAPKILTLGASGNAMELPSPGTSPGMSFLARKVLSLQSPFRERFPSDLKDNWLASEMAESVLTGTPPTGNTPLSQHGGGFFKSIEEGEELEHTAREEEDDDEDDEVYRSKRGFAGGRVSFLSHNNLTPRVDLNVHSAMPFVEGSDRMPLEE